MPELPEVEAARRCVQKVCAGLTITKVYTKETGGGPRDGLLDDIVLELKDSSVAAPDIERPLQGLVLLHVHRKGKQLWFEFSGGDVVAMVHFGMTGSLVVKGHDIPVYMRSSAKDFEQWPPKFTKFMVEFSDGTLLAFRDPRRLGRIKIVTTAESQRLLGKLAVDPTSNDVPSPAELKVQLQGLTAPIKAVLLDQERVFCGIGNYLADEILYQAKLHPATRACALSETHLSVLLQATQYVIKTCIDADSDYKHFPADWLFHARWSKGKSKKSKITLPNGHEVVFEEVGGRTTAVVPSVQVKVTERNARAQKGPEAVKDEKEGGTKAKRKRGVGTIEVEREKDALESIVEVVEDENPSRRGRTTRRK